jgi:predicted phosphohydrolase
MNVWAISDLHLSFARPERRERYAARWRDHAAKIEQNWRAVVHPGDLVLLPGDLSMARSHRDVQPDLEWLARLPGTKVLAPGNHDRWWNGIGGVRPLLRSSLVAVGGDALMTRGVIVCGTLGAPVPPEAPSPTEQRALDREMDALDRALSQAAKLRDDPNRPLYVLRHFPPFDRHGCPGPWVPRFEHACVTACVYGHLHIQNQWALAVQGEVRGVRYYCVAADAIGFRPLRIDTVLAD